MKVTVVQDILDGSNTLNEIIENLLSINRLESGLVKLKLQGIEPADLTTTALAQCAAILADHPVSVQEQPNCPLVACDEVLAVQVIRNILQNAARYPPAGSPIEISLAAHAATGLVQFTITDHGPGLPTDEISKIFAKFWRGSATGHSGTGLGLAICKSIVEAHGGTIGVESQPGHGAKFTIALPLI